MAGVATLAKHLAPILAPHALNAVASLHPKLKGPRNVIKALTGFASRQVSAVPRKSGKARKGKRARRAQQGNSGGALVGGAGGYVHTVNAPVAFAHTTTARPGFYIKHIDADTILVHSVDFVTNFSASSTAGLFNLGQFGVDPTDGTLFTYLSNLLDMYTKYKMTMLKMHYAHNCATNVNGQVMLTWCADPNTTVPTTQAQMVNTNDCIVGSFYEDFAYEANPAEFQQDWYYISDVTDTDEDDRLIRNGILFYATVGSTANQPAGSLLVESEWLLTGRRDPALAPMMNALRVILRSKSTSDEKITVAQSCVKQFVQKMLQKKKAIRERPSIETAHECISKVMGESSPPDSSTTGVAASIAQSIPQLAIMPQQYARR